MRIFKIILTTGLLLVGQAEAVTLADATQSAAVRVEINNTTYPFDTKPRLATVLAPVALQQNWYWPGSRLYRLNSSEPEQLRTLVLQQIEDLKQSAKPALQSELAAVQLQIKSWQLAKRILIPIDYDLARAQAPFNPLFDAGDYKLQLVERPDQVLFWGAIPAPVTLPHKGAVAVGDYLSDIARTTSADKSTVFVINPDGSMLEVGVGAWNWQHTEVMPGGQVFIPFASSWFSADMKQLNENLLALALHRVEQ
ncbi:capsule biosynthesis GfcC family protein [Arsukibacterium sp.]|uniref:capsule biosynthesis GfcC family protein n=1 Tax=Arsukibacterium sp. TaxID=1977258 RepID=UPI001BD62D2E|nr:capsule biosynthesis GfcC family protein [Arsukibacterium sp.]